MNFPELDAVQKELKAKQDALGAIFAEGTVDGNLDTSQIKSIDGTSEDKVAEIQKRNDELTALRKKINDLSATKAAAEAYEARKASPDAEGDEDGDDGSAESGGDEIRKGGRKAQTLGDIYFKSGSHDNKGRSFDIDDVDVKTTFITSAGWAPDVIRTPRVVDLATRPVELLDFIPTVTTTQSAISYMEETTFTNAAVEVTEGAAKPEATLALTERTLTVRKIAVFLPVTDEQLEDVPAAREYINSRLPFMVRQRLSGQIVAGDGIAPNIKGILNTSGIQTQAKGADPTPDAVYKAMTLIRVTGQAEPDAVVFNPTDWQDVRLLRTADGLYIWGNPSEAGPEMIWGINVIQAQAMTLNTAVVGAWKQYSTLYVRKGLTVETGLNADDWTKNKQTIRAEMRCVPVFFRPAAFCSVTGV